MKMGDFWIRRAGGPDLPRRYVRQTKRSNHWMVCILREKNFFSFPFQLPRGAMVWSKERQEVVKNIRVVAGHIGENAEKYKKTRKNHRRRPRAHQQQLERQTLSSWRSSHIHMTTSLHQAHDCIKDMTAEFSKKDLSILYLSLHIFTNLNRNRYWKSLESLLKRWK